MAIERIRLLERVRGARAASITASARAVAPWPPRSKALVRLGGVGAMLDGEAADELDLFVGIAGETVDRDDRFTRSRR